MEFIIYLARNNKMLITVAALIGVVSGGANAMLISLVNKKLTSLQPEEGAFAYFLLVGGVAFLFGIGSQFLMIFLSQRLTFRLRLKLCYQILGMPYRSFEETGSAKLVASFTNDILTVAGTLLAIPSFIVNAAITLGCLVYLGFLSPFALGFLVVFIVLAILSYLLPERFAIRYLTRNREAWDRLFGEFNAMTQGAKELKLHYRRRKDFFNLLLRESADEVRRTGNGHRVIYAVINQWGSLLYFVFMGFLLFVVPQYQELNSKTMTGYVLISLYLAAPVSGLIGFIPSIRSANVAFGKIRALGLDMLGTYEEPRFPEKSEAEEPLPPLKTLKLKGVTHTFYREKEDGNFTLGPIDLTFEAGELVFIIGGNGSGKTTLAKLLTGLYSPEGGQIFVNGEPVGEKRDRYRQYFSAIFDNFYIFEQLLGMSVNKLDERALDYLKQLHLEHKVEIKDGRLSTTQLSTGQRKRLALLTAYLEDRQVYVFDEWAADQDPEFKTVFYHQILPELKARGKTVFVISHDDRFFQIADRIVKLTDGQLEKPQDGLAS